MTAGNRSLSAAPDLLVPHQERPLVQPLAPEPAGDLVVALAGVAGPARRRDVVERVAPAPGDRQHAVALQRPVGRAAVGAAAPRRLERGPLLVAEVVLDALHPALAPRAHLAFRLRDRHLPRLVGPAGWLRQRHLGLPDACLAANRTPKRLASMGLCRPPISMTPPPSFTKPDHCFSAGLHCFMAGCCHQ